MKIKITRPGDTRELEKTISHSYFNELVNLVCDGFILDIEGDKVSIDDYVNNGDLAHRSSEHIISFLKGNTAALQSIEAEMKEQLTAELSMLLQDNDVRVEG